MAKNNQEAVLRSRKEEEKTCLTEQPLLAEGLLPVQERGEQTPRAQGAEVDRKIKQRRGRKQSKLQRLLDFQTSLCDRWGLAPTRLMKEMKAGKKIRLARRRMRETKIKVMTGRKRELQEAGREEDILVYPYLSRHEEVKVERVLEPKLGLGRRGKDTLEPEAGLVGGEEEREIGSKGENVGAGHLPPLHEAVTASGNYLPCTLRQTHVGDMVEGGLPGWGPEMTWVDRWLGQGWAGPLGSVYFCLNCQLAGNSWRIGHM